MTQTLSQVEVEKCPLLSGLETISFPPARLPFCLALLTVRFGGKNSPGSWMMYPSPSTISWGICFASGLHIGSPWLEHVDTALKLGNLRFLKFYILQGSRLTKMSHHKDFIVKTTINISLYQIDWNKELNE